MSHAASSSPVPPAVAAAQMFAEIWPAVAAAVPDGGPPVLPRHLVWLNGAPGAGKGTNTRTIMRALGIEAPAVVVSDLLCSPEMVRIKNSGGLVGDRDVVGLLLRRLLQPCYAAGAIIDGFPRSSTQAEILHLLSDRMADLAAVHPGRCPPPDHRLIVLTVPEEIAVERQLRRGREAVAANEQARRHGGPLQEIRATDIDPAGAAKRFRVFTEHSQEALDSLHGCLPSHVIDASGGIAEVARAVEAALA